ncbi:hypothetical protein DTL70_13750 [Streptomyces diacarni]|uniref:Septum formation initiator n=1 Tax=Streptomyces diacarni TaxID=2800381 RepID=A0A367F008_9ACTN|nr:hypothetical protein [Streptomyces diacarni]RCG23694.1 hypothetical protein DTL70_13750 [Streptomyces diacarni]
MNDEADDEQQRDPATARTRTPTDPRSERRRRRLAAAGWLCAVAAAFLLGAWSFSHADPGGQYSRPEPLSDDGVRHELTQARQRAGSATPDPDPSSSHSTPSAAPPSQPHRSPTASPSRSASPVTRTVRFPEGLGTALAQCRTDARTVKLLSWTPAEGYSADDVEPGPARTATVELEPADDDASDLVVSLRCADGRPHATVRKEADDGDDGDDD